MIFSPCVTITPLPETNALWKILWRVTTLWINTDESGSRYCLNAYNEWWWPRYGLNAVLLIRTLDHWRTWLSSAEGIRIVSICSQGYRETSSVQGKEVILIRCWMEWIYWWYCKTVFGVLMIECGLLLWLSLLIVGTMLSLYSCLGRFDFPYFDTMSTMLLIAVLQSCTASTR